MNASIWFIKLYLTVAYHVEDVCACGNECMKLSYAFKSWIRLMFVELNHVSHYYMKVLRNIWSVEYQSDLFCSVGICWRVFVTSFLLLNLSSLSFKVTEKNEFPFTLFNVFFSCLILHILIQSWVKGTQYYIWYLPLPPHC